MKRILKDLGEWLREIHEKNGEMQLRSLDIRARNLQKAVEDGWFKYFLIGAGLVGLNVIYNGNINNNEIESGIGKGMLLMDTIYASCIYLPKLYQNISGRLNR